MTLQNYPPTLEYSAQPKCQSFGIPLCFVQDMALFSVFAYFCHLGYLNRQPTSLRLSRPSLLDQVSQGVPVSEEAADGKFHHRRSRRFNLRRSTTQYVRCMRLPTYLLIPGCLCLYYRPAAGHQGIAPRDPRTPSAGSALGLDWTV